MNLFVLFTVGAAVALILYFVPTIIARRRYHPDTMAIFVVNLFAGWTAIGWLVALVWALTGTAIDPRDRFLPNDRRELWR